MTEVFDLVYHGGGGFTYNEVWQMDVPKRRFNIKKINESGGIARIVYPENFQECLDELMSL